MRTPRPTFQHGKVLLICLLLRLLVGALYWMLMHNNSLRVLYFTVGPGVLELASIATSVRLAARTTCSKRKEARHD